MDRLKSLVESVPIITVNKSDSFYTTVGTPGYQQKFKRDDMFLKASAVINRVIMYDHIVEKIASDFAESLGIGCVHQDICKIKLGDFLMNGVKSRNFELDGYTFIPFKSFLEFNRVTYIEEELVRCSTIDKMELCANVVSSYSNVRKLDYLGYLVDCAVLDCLVGNVDRHLKNFGLFLNSDKSYSIPLIFDNGMGMFENDSDRLSYKTLQEADRYLYISPYGEDPFDMVDILFDNCNMEKYQFDNIREPEVYPNDLAKLYFDKMFNYILRRF